MLSFCSDLWQNGVFSVGHPDVIAYFLCIRLQVFTHTAQCLGVFSISVLVSNQLHCQWLEVLEGSSSFLFFIFSPHRLCFFIFVYSTALPPTFRSRLICFPTEPCTLLSSSSSWSLCSPPPTILPLLSSLPLNTASFYPPPLLSTIFPHSFAPA